MTPSPARSTAILLVSPRIPQNVGAIGRLCSIARVSLHLTRPIPFQLNDRALARSGMDYWDDIDLTIHEDFAAARAALAPRRLVLFTTRGTQSHWDFEWRADDILVFGNEVEGLPESLRAEFAPAMTVRIPQESPHARSLNLAMAAGIGLYEVLRRFPAPPSGG